MPDQPDQIGRYRIESRIALGGQGRLYKAYDPVLRRPVAIKLLREPDDPDLRARFARECRAVANLTHQNIVTVFEVGEFDGQPFMAMEYIHGRTLTSIIESDPLPSIVRRLELVESLCDGLAFAHKRNVVHRDIKPANLMVDEDGRLKIVDFGIARAGADANLTQAGLLVGTVNYMSPEQVEGRDLGGHSDMFAVGAVLYELLSRRQAFPGKNPTAVLHRILNTEPEPLGGLCPDLDPAIPPIVARALRKNPAERYADLHEMRLAIAGVRERIEDAPALDPGDSVLGAQADLFTPPPTRRGTDLQEIARRRTQQIEGHLTAAEQALDGGRHQDAIAHSEEALVLDPANTRAQTLAERARREAATGYAATQTLAERESDVTPGAAAAVSPAASGPRPLPQTSGLAAHSAAPESPPPGLAAASSAASRSSSAPAWRDAVDTEPTLPPPSIDPVRLADAGAPEAAGRSRRPQVVFAAAVIALSALGYLTWWMWTPQPRLESTQAEGGAVTGRPVPSEPGIPAAPVPVPDAPGPDPVAPGEPVEAAPARSHAAEGTGSREPARSNAPPASPSTPAPPPAASRTGSDGAGARPDAAAPLDAGPPSVSSGRGLEPGSTERARGESPDPPRESSDRPPAPPAEPAPPVASRTPPGEPRETPPAPGETEEDRVHRTLSAYTQALASRDVARVRSVYPAADAGDLERMFDGLTELTMEITPRRTRIDGDRATVEAGVTQWTQRQRDQRRRAPPTNLEFRLQRTPGGWIISDIRPR